MAYHHGALRQQLIDSAAQFVAASGPDAVSLRELARRAGVSHGAPAHHFGDRSGLFTAVAVDGFRMLLDALERAGGGEGAARRLVTGYVAFALSNRGYYLVMFRSDLLHPDVELRELRARTGETLERAAPAPGAAWALVHGVVGLSLSGDLAGRDPVELAERAVGAWRSP